MKYNARIELRDKIVNKLKELKIIVSIKNKFYKINDKKKLYILLDNHIQLKEEYYKYINEFRSEEEAIYCLLHNDDYENHHCVICNNISKFYNLRHPYHKTCGNKECIKKSIPSKEANEKRISTNLKRYNVKYISQRKETKEKIKDTNIKKYGYNCSSKNEQVKEKAKKTFLEHYGKDNPMKCIEIREKQKKNNLKKYNTENVFAANEVKERIKNTNIKKYNVINAKQKNITNYDIWINNEKFKEFIINKYNKKGSFLTLNEINGFFNVIPQSIKKKVEKLNLLDYFYIQKSNLEIDFDNFLNNNNIIHKKHYRGLYDINTNGNKEIDFLCNENIGFEINDIWSHNALQNNEHINNYKDKYYHYNKKILAEKYGIQLIHIWEWEIRDPNIWDKLSKWILNICNNNKIKIYARKCSIRKISLQEEKEFLNEYHLEGYKESNVCYGLYHNEELVQVMSFKYIENDNQWQLLRYCIAYGYKIINSAQNLLMKFINEYSPTLITAYCNFDKYSKKIYEELGFKLLKEIGPQIIWCNKKMDYYDCIDSHEMNMNDGYIPIYNSGIAIYYYNNKEDNK